MFLFFQYSLIFDFKIPPTPSFLLLLLPLAGLTRQWIQWYFKTMLENGVIGMGLQLPRFATSFSQTGHQLECNDAIMETDITMATRDIVKVVCTQSINILASRVQVKNTNSCLYIHPSKTQRRRERERERERARGEGKERRVHTHSGPLTGDWPQPVWSQRPSTWSPHPIPLLLC